jgi:hypothetical protein
MYWAISAISLMSCPNSSWISQFASRLKESRGIDAPRSGASSSTVWAQAFDRRATAAFSLFDQHGDTEKIVEPAAVDAHDHDFATGRSGSSEIQGPVRCLLPWSATHRSDCSARPISILRVLRCPADDLPRP